MKILSVIVFIVAGVSLPAQITNFSARTFIGDQSEAAELTFTLKTIGTPEVLIRATGPELEGYGITGVVADPLIELYQDGVLLDSNNNWEDSDGTAIVAKSEKVGAFPLQPGSNSAALNKALSAGAYSVKIFGIEGDPGKGLIELYLPQTEGDSLSSLAFQTAINEAQIGLVNSGKNQKYLCRLLGPALGEGGVVNPSIWVADLASAPLEHLDSNDNWGDRKNPDELNGYASALSWIPLKNGSSDSALIIEPKLGVFVVSAKGDGKIGRFEIGNINGILFFSDLEILSIILSLGLLMRFVTLRNYSPHN